MQERAIETPPLMSRTGPSERGCNLDSPAPARVSLRRRIALGAKIMRVRMRFAIVFVALFIVGKWDSLRNYWDKATRPAASLDTTGHAVSLDTEYFCPMDPGVVSDWSGKCSICNMTLVRRKKGDSIQLPEGIVSRMQISPRRLHLAGIQTTTAAYRPLTRLVTAIGHVPNVADSLDSNATHTATILVDVFQKDLPLLAAGQQVEVRADRDWATSCRGHVGEIDPDLPVRFGTARVPVELDHPDMLQRGITVTARIEVPVADLEPFRSMPRTAPPLKDDSLREVFFCPEHSEILKTKSGKCPVGKNELEREVLNGNQRVDWWCPMHPNVTADTPGAQCEECNGMKLLPRIVTYSPEGQVLAVPDSAVIDTGTKRVVYVERSAGMFEGVEVITGPRCGDYYPVVKGLEVGQRVATAGSFLIDAETRLNPGVAAGYFGAASSQEPAK